MARRKRNTLFFKAAIFCAVASVFLAAGMTIMIAHKALTLPPLDFQKAQQTSVTVTDRNKRLLRAFATPEGRWRLPVKLDDVDDEYLKMLLAFEDKRFYEHNGIDYKALVRAAFQLFTTGRIVSGGSTITMQLARLLDGLQARSFEAKLTQLIRAIEIERRLTKRQILALYLTLAPFGGNLEGIRSASLAYFGKEPMRLSWSERALLVALPQSPETRRPDRFAKKASAARNRVLDRMTIAGLISNTEAHYAKQAKIKNTRHRFPMFAAHLAEKEILRRPKQPHHHLTIDRTLQRKLEELVAAHIRTLGPRLSAAILVVDHNTGEIRAYVGSTGYLDKTRFGAIDMIDAIRSPGSTLKPFIYGLAFDQGLAHPETLIEDVPSRFGAGYAPKNFDKEYRGTMTIRTALQTSRNIPAIKILDAIGPARLAHRLKQMDAGLDIPHNLSIGLGGVGMSLRSLTTLYVALARGGHGIALRTRKNRRLSFSTPHSLFSSTAAWYVSNILSGAPAPKNARTGKVAFKTGTSYGHRDAWAVGFDGKYVVGVWIGRPDATPTPGLMGLKAAAPLLFESFARIGPQIPLRRAPTSAIVTTTAKLPKRLIHFDDSISAQTAASKSAPHNNIKIIFPPNNAELDLATGNIGEVMPVALSAEGGKLPLTWLADDIPLRQEARRRSAFWKPDAPGFYKFTVIDATGAVDRVHVRVR